MEVIRTAKKTHYGAALAEFRKDMGKTWTVLKELMGTGKSQTEVDCLKSDNGEEIHSKLKIAAKFNEDFVRLGTNSLTPGISTADLDGLPTVTPLLKFTGVNEEFVHQEIRRLKSRTATGLDNISVRLIKSARPALLQPLAHLISESLRTGSFPDALKMARVTPIFKSGEKDVSTNYRPISVLPALSKIFERAAQQQLLWHLERNRLLASEQSGFRPRHSTATSLLRLTNDINRAIDDGMTTAAVFLDVSKAFDTVPHGRLLLKLQRLGVSGTELDWFSSYLSGRSQLVAIGRTKSPLLPITTGVPQGSILGPILFLAYINDFPNCLKLAKANLYADDTVVYAASKSPSQLEDLLTAELSVVSDWFRRNGLVLNAGKTVLMTFGKAKQLEKFAGLKIRVDQVELKMAASTKYLGVTLDSTLSYDLHVDQTCAKVARSLGCVGRVKRLMPERVRRTLVEAIVLPHLDYCDSVWLSCSAGCRRRLQQLQNRAAKIVLGVKNKFSSEAALQRLGWKPLEERRQLHLGLEVFKAQRKISPTYLSELFIQKDQIHRHNTRSQLHRQRVNPGKNGSAAFSIVGPKLWESLPAGLKETGFIGTFKSLLLNCLPLTI